jgi:two-component system sensor histidine kinase RpfC
VLLVEDNRTNRTVTTRTLEKLGHVVTSADSGTAALAHIAATQFDLVLLDMEMPGIGGLEVLMRTKQLPDKEWMPPIFVLTAHDSYEAKMACETAGAAGFLTKPITTNRLQQELAHVCRRTHKGEDSTSDRAVDASRLSDQLALSHGDFSYVNELIANWKCDYAQSIDHLERSADANDFESIRHILHNVESGAREVGAHKIAGICRSQRKTITPATAHVLASIQRSLQTAYTDTLVVFARLDALLQSPRHTQSIYNART